MSLAYDPSPEDGPLRQAEVVKDVVEVRVAALTDGEVEFVRRVHKISIVMTQDCDLEQDHALRFPPVADSTPDATAVDDEANALQTILLCDAYDAGDIEPYLPSKFSRKERDWILDNRNERYHCLDESGPGATDDLPPLLLDLRTPFGVPPALLYDQLAQRSATRGGIVPPIFMHDLMHRFYSYHSRVALPPVEDAQQQGGFAA